MVDQEAEEQMTLRMLKPHLPTDSDDNLSNALLINPYMKTSVHPNTTEQQNKIEEPTTNTTLKNAFTLNLCQSKKTDIN